jgi:hypothetical protein
MRGLVVAVVAAVAIGCGPAARPRPAGPPIGLVLPATDGSQIDLAKLRGRLVVVHVFASWSLAAQADVIQLDAVYAEGATAVIGVGVDLDGAVVLRPWQRGSGARYPVAVADDGVRAGKSALGPIDRVPVTLVLDRAGAVVRRHVGPLPRGALEKWLRELR